MLDRPLSLSCNSSHSHLNARKLSVAEGYCPWLPCSSWFSAHPGLEGVLQDRMEQSCSPDGGREAQHIVQSFIPSDLKPSKTGLFIFQNVFCFMWLLHIILCFHVSYSQHHQKITLSHSLHCLYKYNSLYRLVPRSWGSNIVWKQDQFPTLDRACFVPVQGTTVVMWLANTIPSSKWHHPQPHELGVTAGLWHLGGWQFHIVLTGTFFLFS